MLACRPIQHCMSTLVLDDEYVLEPVWSYKLYVSGSFHPFCTDWKIFQDLAGVKHLTRSGMRHFFQKLIILVVGLFSPFDMCYQVRRLRLMDRPEDNGVI
jgi:hypothetical protein